MLKRILAVALAIVMVMAMAAVAVSAAEVENPAGADTSSESTGTSGTIQFNAAPWKNATQIYCHIWINGGSEEFYGWKNPAEKCTKVSGTTWWEYDLSTLDKSTEISGGLKANEDYCIIFFDESGLQTYDTTFGTACIGDKLTMTGKQIENPIDSNKKGYEATWLKNSSKYGPHLAISSVGNFLGSKLCPNETGTEVIGDWLIGYAGSMNCDPIEVLSKALPKFGVKDVTAVMAYVTANNDGIYENEFIQEQLEKGYKAAYGEEVKIDQKEVENKKNQLEQSGGDTSAISDDNSSSSSGSGSSSTSNNVSGSNPDGQNDTILFVLAAIMLVSAGAFVISRKRTEV